jgi:hypothetical protein
MNSPESSDRPRKRRAINACASCRSSKVKCDGKRPCQRCVRNETSCQYHDAAKDENTQRIERLEAEIELLRAQVDDTRGAVSAAEPMHTRTTSLDAIRNCTRRCNIIEAGLVSWEQASFWFRRHAAGKLPILHCSDLTIASSRAVYDTIVAHHQLR